MERRIIGCFFFSSRRRHTRWNCDWSSDVCYYDLADIVMFDGEACILSALTDITDRTRAEAALRESERRFMVAFHANPLPMSITSLRDHRHLEVNEAAVRT